MWSAILPRGIQNAAEAKRNDILTQLNSAAFIFKSALSCGKATFIAAERKGLRMLLITIANKSSL